ncbi:hypothetical protein [Caballeronia sp. GAFFF3]|uniref:hypothetical protein n=1 Tax=Caballeronia sp. GAFFF3 TaxID=2921759 RepID=UPI002028E940|nr:hypothetical protein [Caballeronia sp. GAFFF3]
MITFRVEGGFFCFLRSPFCFRWIPYSRRSINVAPVRGGTYFLCCCKESRKRKQLFKPAVTRNLGSPLVLGGTRLKSALIEPIGLGSRTIRQTIPFNALVQHETASAQRYALPLGMHRKPTQTRTETNGAFTTANILFFAALDDEVFLSKVNSGERFGKGDVLVVDLRQIQSIEAGALKNEYRIIKVHEHRAPLQQALL